MGARKLLYQGQELDNEIKGEGNSINYKYRMHSLFREYGNPRVGRFFAVDPLTRKYTDYSPYSFSGNKVIHSIELEGLEDVIMIYTRDANGIVKPAIEWNSTYYATDANGITMAIYKEIEDHNNFDLFKIESMLYGGARLGLKNENIKINNNYNPITHCNNDGLQTAVIEIGSQITAVNPFPLPNFNIKLNSQTIFSGNYDQTNASAFAQTIVDFLNLYANNNGFTAQIVTVTGSAYFNIELKETVKGSLSGNLIVETVSWVDINNDGVINVTEQVYSYPPSILRQPSVGDCYSKRILGRKKYELSNHLGNVMEVITDRKIGIDDGTYDTNGNFVSSTPDGMIDYYLADIVSYSDYYPFGMQMPGRNGTVSGAEYRYAFNGMETDKEVSGTGNSYTTQFRQYDPRLGRWKSLDPLAGKFPNQSPFCAFNNNPIYFVDPLGLEGEGPGDGDKKKKGNGFWKKRDKNGDLTNEDADTRQLPEVTVNVPLPDKEKEEINARRRIKGIPSIQFENKLTKAQQKILLDRFNRMAARSGVWSKGTKELYDAIYYGRESYDKYFNYNPVFGESFAYYWNQGAKAWDKKSIGHQLQTFSAATIGGSMGITIVVPMALEGGGYLLAQVPLSGISTGFSYLFSYSTKISFAERFFSGASNLTIQLYNSGGDFGGVDFISFGGSIASGNPFLGNSLVSSGLSLTYNKGFAVSSFSEFSVNYAFGRIGKSKYLTVPALGVSTKYSGQTMEIYLRSILQMGVDMPVNIINTKINHTIGGQ